jgi:DNA-binding MarR family transcriptional regulator
MSREDFVRRKPLISLVDRANRAMAADMIDNAVARGYTWAKPAHNAVFATLYGEGGRAADMAARSGITRQSMGEVIRDLVAMGILEMVPDPADRRAKLVRYTAKGLEAADGGFEHIRDLEERIVDEVGAEEYEITRRVLARVTEMLTVDRETSDI